MQTQRVNRKQIGGKWDCKADKTGRGRRDNVGVWEEGDAVLVVMVVVTNHGILLRNTSNS